MKRTKRSAAPEPHQIAAEVRREVAGALGHREPKPGFFERIERFAALLATWGRKTNLTASPDIPAEVAFQILDSLEPILIAQSDQVSRLTGLFSRGKRILDFGSGAGFPALILAAASDADFMLTEIRRKRASFLEVAIGEMGLDNARMLSPESTLTALARSFDAVMSRAVGVTAEFLEMVTFALRPGGIALIYASQSQQIDTEAAADAGLTDGMEARYVVRRGRLERERKMVTWCARTVSPIGNGNGAQYN